MEEAQERGEFIQSGGVMIAINSQVKPLLDGVYIHEKKLYGELGLMLEGCTPASI